MRNGVVMAVDEINALGGLVGHKLKYIEVDDKDSLTEDEVSTAFRRAIDVEKADVDLLRLPPPLGARIRHLR